MKKLAFVLILAVASTAFGSILYGDNPTTVGMSSESYDWWVDGGSWDGIMPLPLGTEGGYVTPAGFEGYLLLALNPYTGEIWTEVGAADQHVPTSSALTGAPVTNMTPSATGLSEDCIFITASHHWDGGGGYFGAFVNSSADGSIRHAGSDGIFPAGQENFYLQGHSAGDPIDGTGNWAGGVTSSFFGHVGAHNWWGYTGTGGGTSASLAFELDGNYGWMDLSFSGDRSGVTLNSYGFEVPEPATMSLLAIGGIAALIRRKK
jgi:hypothetical protein